MTRTHARRQAGPHARVWALCALLGALLGALGSLPAWRAQASEDPADPSSRPALRSAGPEQPPPPKEFLYDGNYTSFLAGVLVPTLDRPPSGLKAQGWGLSLGTRLSVITQFVDVGLDLSHAQWEGAAATLQRTELGAKLGLHPGFPLIVFNSWMYDVFSGLHGYLGLSMARLGLSGGSAVLQTTGDALADAVDWRPCLSAGVGADIPISPRNRSYGWWLTLRYELRWTRFGEAIPDYDLGDGQAMFLLNYRSYNNSWARFPRPF